MALVKYSVHAYYTFHLQGQVESEGEEEAEELLLTQARRQILREIRESDGACIDVNAIEVES